MNLELEGKVAVVGGASKGLGRACAQVLAEEGCKLVICSRSQADLDKAAGEIRAATGAEVLVVAGDLDRYDTIRGLIAAAVDRFGGIDILVNNSGGPPLAQAHAATEEQWATAVQRSLLFFARLSREALGSRLECVPDWSPTCGLSWRETPGGARRPRKRRATPARRRVYELPPLSPEAA